MEIFRRGEAPFVQRDGDETRRYYESPERGFRIVETIMPSGHVQNEHRHEELLDITLVLEGEIQVMQREDGILREETLRAGDMICFPPPMFHNVANRSGAAARTLTLKIRADSSLAAEDVARLFKTDWIGFADGRG